VHKSTGFALEGIVPEIAMLVAESGWVNLLTDSGGDFHIVVKAGPSIVGLPMAREQAESMGRLILAHATGPRPIGEILTPVLERAGVTRDMLVEGAEIVPGGGR
jgi:hypothetical protein